MKIKNVKKNFGKEVSIKTRLNKVTGCRGMYLCDFEIDTLLKPPLFIASDVNDAKDVLLKNFNNELVYVHHKFIKLIKGETK